MRTFVRLLAAVAVAAAGLAVVTGPAAEARTGNVVISRDKPYKEQKTALVGNNPGAQATAPVPLQCNNGVPGQPTAPGPACDAWKLAILRDGITEEEDYFVTVTITWTDPTTTNDLDLYLWKDPVDAAEDEPVSQSATSTSGAGPYKETAKMFRPRGIHWIVVNNFAGANSGYLLEASIDVVQAEIVTELLEPDRVPTNNGPDDLDTGEEFEAEEPADEPTFDFDSTFGEVPEDLGNEVDFSTGGSLSFDPGVFGDIPLTVGATPGIGGPGFGIGNGGGGPAPDIKVAPASGTQLALWLGLVPLAFLGGLGGLLIKRRPAALSI